jgi:hypothetical protein
MVLIGLIFPNIICNYITAESNNNDSIQQQDKMIENRNLFKDICAALNEKI